MSKEASHAPVAFVIFIALVLVLAVALSPWAVFWAIGILFDYHIPFNFMTWWAFWVIQLVALGGLRNSTAKN